MKWPLVGLVFLCVRAFAFNVHGTVYDENKTPLGYSNIYIKGTSNGTSANAEGQYSMSLAGGKYSIVFQHLGYRQFIQDINVQGDTELNVTLQVLQYEIRDVVINPNEDPANAVIRKAIERRKYFLNAVEDYSCDVYLKGMGRVTQTPDRIFGIKINKGGSHNSPNGNGIVYLSESKSRLYYKKPGKFHEVIYSSKRSGSDSGYTFNSAQDFYFNFYESSIPIPVVSDRPFISPLSGSAFFYYNFHMLGAYTEGDKLVNKIQVTPKRKNDPCFTGTLSIIEDNWNIHSLQLYLFDNNGLRYIDTLKVTQYYIPVKNDLWLPTQQRYDASGGILGIRGDGYYIGIFSNYILNDMFGMMPPVAKADSVPSKKQLKEQKKKEKKITRKIFTPEIIKIEDSANKKSTVYWDSIRPIPLNKIELDDYKFKDSLQTIYNSKAYKDSTARATRKKLMPLSILFGPSFKVANKAFLTIPGLIGLVNYNTVEGVNISLPFSLRRDFARQRFIKFAPEFRYGFTNRHFNAMGTITFRNSQTHEEFISLSGGKYISQFNEAQPQLESGNTEFTLLARLNFMKIYEQYFVKLTYSREIVNGIDGSLAVTYAQRFPLENQSLYSFFYREVAFTPNAVDLPGLTGHEGNISRHNLFRFDLNLHFTFGRKYITTPNGKYRLDDSNYPELYFTYKKAIPIGSFSDLNYDMLELRTEGKIPMKLLGTMYYRLGGGGFPNHKLADYADYRHFYGNLVSYDNNALLGFYLIRYYRHSTDEYFAEAHIEHHFEGFFFHKIPLIRKLKIGEVLGFHFLYTPARKQYFQIDAGIDNIYNILRVDFVVGFGDVVHQFGVRLGMNLGIIRR